MELEVQVNLSREAEQFIIAFLSQYNVDKLAYIRLRGSKGIGNHGYCQYPISTRKYNKLRHIRRNIQPRKYYHIVCNIGRDTTYPRKISQYIGCKVPQGFKGDPSGLARNQLDWVYDEEEVRDINEETIWIFGHEIFHFLRKTRQVDGRNTQSQANKFGFKLLRDFKTQTYYNSI